MAVSCDLDGITPQVPLKSDDLVWGLFHKKDLEEKLRIWL